MIQKLEFKSDALGTTLRTGIGVEALLVLVRNDRNLDLTFSLNDYSFIIVLDS